MKNFRNSKFHYKIIEKTLTVKTYFNNMTAVAIRSRSVALISNPDANKQHGIHEELFQNFNVSSFWGITSTQFDDFFNLFFEIKSFWNLVDLSSKGSISGMIFSYLFAAEVCVTWD